MDYGVWWTIKFNEEDNDHIKALISKEYGKLIVFSFNFWMLRLFHLNVNNSNEYT